MNSIPAPLSRERRLFDFLAVALRLVVGFPLALVAMYAAFWPLASLSRLVDPGETWSLWIFVPLLLASPLLLRVGVAGRAIAAFTDAAAVWLTWRILSSRATRPPSSAPPTRPDSPLLRP